jgi:hypothetical protein
VFCLFHAFSVARVTRHAARWPSSRHSPLSIAGSSSCTYHTLERTLKSWSLWNDLLKHLAYLTCTINGQRCKCCQITCVLCILLGRLCVRARARARAHPHACLVACVRACVSSKLVQVALRVRGVLGMLWVMLRLQLCQRRPRSKSTRLQATLRCLDLFDLP